MRSARGTEVPAKRRSRSPPGREPGRSTGRPRAPGAAPEPDGQPAPEPERRDQPQGEARADALVRREARGEATVELDAEHRLDLGHGLAREQPVALADPLGAPHQVDAAQGAAMVIVPGAVGLRRDLFQGDSADPV